jgi:hypothetical protein
MVFHAQRYFSLSTDEVIGNLEAELKRRKGDNGRFAEQEIADLVPVLIARVREAEAKPLEAKLLDYLADIELRIAKAMTAGLPLSTCHDGSPDWLKWQGSEIVHLRARALRKLAEGEVRTSRLKGSGNG